MKNLINDYWYYLSFYSSCLIMIGYGLLLTIGQFCLAAVLCNCGLDDVALSFLPVLRFFFGG